MSTVFPFIAEAPKTKRKKLRAKDPPLLASHAQSPPPVATATSTEAVVTDLTAKPATRSKTGSATSKPSKTAKVPRESEDPSSVQEPSPTATASTSAGIYMYKHCLACGME